MVRPEYVELLRELHADKSRHLNGSLLKHLQGTHNLLQAWKNPEMVCVAGLFHSIYGTENYRKRSAALESRSRIAHVIGMEAEELAFIFCVSHRPDFFMEVESPSPVLVSRLSQQPIAVSQAQVRALMEIEVANYVDQTNPYLTSDVVISYMRNMLRRAGGQHLSAPAHSALGDFLERASKPLPTLTRVPLTWLWRWYALRHSSHSEA